MRLKPSLLAAPQVSRAVAEAVAIAAVEAGLARLAKTPEQGLQCHDEAEWWPTDQPLQPSL
jgi:malate dehydrogenase (oxaloacetate-decarboxylating)